MADHPHLEAAVGSVRTAAKLKDGSRSPFAYHGPEANGGVTRRLHPSEMASRTPLRVQICGNDRRTCQDQNQSCPRNWSKPQKGDTKLSNQGGKRSDTPARDLVGVPYPGDRAYTPLRGDSQDRQLVAVVRGDCTNRNLLLSPEPTFKTPG